MNNSNLAQANKRALFCAVCFLTPIARFFGLGLLSMGVNAVFSSASPTPVVTALLRKRPDLRLRVEPLLSALL